MLYILALEPFLCQLKANLVLRCLTLPGSREVARYTAYADDVSVLITSSAEVEDGWLVGFYGISTFVGYLMPNPFLCK